MVRRWPGLRLDHGQAVTSRIAVTGNGCGPGVLSPEQIAARLKLDFPDDDSMRISHEAIYQALVESRIVV